MKAFTTLIALLFSLNGFSQRYLTDQFPVLDSTIGGIYGTAIDYQSNSQDLLFDFYEPANDTVSERPLVIYIHGGGFAAGSRTYPSVQEICRRLANKGYVVANIDYRLDPGFDLYNSSTDRRAMTDAMHDAKQAIRFFKANATTYKIDTSLVFIGGESAGAVTSMMASFVDKQSEMNAYPMASPNDPIGSLANPNVGNQVHGTLCLCGMILDTLAMELPTDPNILWTHGTDDTYIPIALAFNVVLRAANIGLPIEAKAYQGATHCPWYFGNPSWDSYLDSTIVDIVNFLYPRVGPILNTTGNQNEPDISIYPNPFQNRINIATNTPFGWSSEATIKVCSVLGETVYESGFGELDSHFTLNLEDLADGYYFLTIETNGERLTRRIVKGW